VDAYSESMTRLIDDRLAELRRDAERERLARSVRHDGRSARRKWFPRPPGGTVADVATLPVSPDASRVAAPETAHRRSA
jgi:hypothetical protein